MRKGVLKFSGLLKDDYKTTLKTTSQYKLLYSVHHLILFAPKVIKGHIKIALARKINNKEIKTTEHSGPCQYVTCL